jgi:uncharacterized protein (DUF169 family)
MTMENIRAYLGMKYGLVAIKILKEKPAEITKKRMRFCEMVKKATEGEVFFAEKENISCPNAEVALGLAKPIYVDVQPRINSGTKAVGIGPVEKIEAPDIILAILNPKQAMEISSLLGGMEARFSGNMAVCGEATARPFIEGKPNATFLCGGARMFAGFRDSELMLGAPPSVFKELSQRIDAVSKTCTALCGCKTSDLSPIVIENFRKMGFEKGIDYFFGKINGKNVRIYLNKDLEGRMKYITIHLPIKGEVKAKKPLIVKKRGNWTDVSLTFSLGEGIDINTGKGLREAVLDIAKKLELT